MTSNAAAILQITFAAKLARFVSSGIEKLHISVPLQITEISVITFLVFIFGV